MGLDVQIWARGGVNGERVKECEARFKERLPGFAYGVHHSPDDDLVAVYSMSRYYGVGYERGDWPTIYAAIMLMRAMFPASVVSYQSDSWDVDDGDWPISDESLAEVWRHWCGPDGDAYRRGA